MGAVSAVSELPQAASTIPAAATIEARATRFARRAMVDRSIVR
jgi:hypothetical protein